MKRGDLFLSLSDKNIKGKGAKTEAQDEYRKKSVLCAALCARMKLPDFVLVCSTKSQLEELSKDRKVHKNLEAEDGDKVIVRIQVRPQC